MPDRVELEGLFVRHLPHVERAVAAVCRRHGLRDADAEDCASWVKLRIVEDDYAVFAKFRGESSITTYLTVVVAMLVRDWRASEWGRWRPSAAAQRLGPIAIRLEKMVRRDGVPLREAVERLRTNGETRMSDGELSTLVKQLPVRAPLRPVEMPEETVADRAAENGAADAGITSNEADAERRAADGALAAAMAKLSAEDRVILRMRYWDGASVADVSRALGLEQKPLYRRLDRLLAELRKRLEAGGMGKDKLRDLLDDLP